MVLGWAGASPSCRRNTGISVSWTTQTYTWCPDVSSPWWGVQLGGAQLPQPGPWPRQAVSNMGTNPTLVPALGQGGAGAPQGLALLVRASWGTQG